MPAVIAEESRASLQVSSEECDWEKTEQYQKQRALLEKITQNRTGLNPKPAQLRFAMALLMGHDATCIAATGFGKSLAFQMAAMMLEGQLGIIITPIEALGEEQVQSCNDIRLKAVSLVQGDVDGNSVKIRDIVDGKYDLGKSFQGVQVIHSNSVCFRRSLCFSRKAIRPR